MSAPTPPLIRTQPRASHSRCSYRVTYAIEFFCLSVAKLLVLDRMVTFAVAREQGRAERWSNGGRGVMAVVVAGNLVGLGSNLASAVSYKQASDLAAAAAESFAANTTAAYAADASSTGSLQGDQSKSYTATAQSTGSVQEFSEVFVLLVIIAAFAFTGAACARRIAASLPAMSRGERATGQHLRWQLVATVTTVFVTFLLRAVFSVMYAFASATQNTEDICTGDTCSSTCLTTGRLMLKWLTATPEFQAIVVLIASPLTLLVALWGMTTERTLKLMRNEDVMRSDTVALGRGSSLGASLTLNPQK